MVIRRNIIPIVLVTATALSALALTQPSVLADSDVVTTTTINVPEACTMNGTVNTAHAATLINGTYSGTNYGTGIGQTTLKVYCNDVSGFAIYAIGYTNNEYGNNKLHWGGASSASDDTHDISTGIYTSGDTTTSTWSMKLAAVSGTYTATIDDGVAAHNNSTDNFTTWHTVPTEYKRVAYRLSGTDAEQSGAGTGSSITTTYDAYVSLAQPAGSYLGQVKYTLVHPNNATAPSKEIVDLGYMQEFATLSAAEKTSVIASMVEDQQYQLKDSRDEKTYYIAKLKDENVWMTQNLDFDLDSTTTLTPADTDVPANWTPPVSTYTATNASSAAWCYSGDCTFPISYDPGDYYWNGTLSDGVSPSSTYISSTGNAHYHLGNYYRWAAAIAVDSGEDYIWEGGWSATSYQSICPAGWTLPRNGNINKSFENLLRLYDSDYGNHLSNETTAFWSSPIYFSLAGYLGGSYRSGITGLDLVGLKAFYQTPEVEIEEMPGWTGMYEMHYHYTEQNNDSGDGSDKNEEGLTIRCVVK